jgi:hypothetical protein
VNETNETGSFLAEIVMLLVASGLARVAKFSLVTGTTIALRRMDGV